MISQGSSGSVAKDAGVRYGGPGSNFGKVFLDIFVHLFYPVVTALLEYLNPTILHLLGFLLHNFVAIALLLFKLSKGIATMISLSTHQFSSYSYTEFTL